MTPDQRAGSQCGKGSVRGGKRWEAVRPSKFQRGLLTCTGACPENDDPINAADPGYVTFTTPGPGPRGGFDTTAIDGSFSEPTLVYARATGLISKHYVNSWVWPPAVRGTATFPLDPNGWVWGSAYQCVGHLEIYYVRPNGSKTTNVFCTRDGTNLLDAQRNPFDTTFVFEGANGKIKRFNSLDSGPSCGFGAYPVCFDFAGSQIVELVPYRVTLNVNADRDPITYGDTVNFTASGSASLTIRSWMWASTSIRDSIREVASVFSDPPAAIQQLGRISYEWVAPQIREIDSVDSGPNRQAKFLTVLPRIRFDIMINRAALAPASIFVLRHPVTRGVNSSRADVVAQLGPIMAHEGMNKEALSHSRRYSDFMARMRYFARSQKPSSLHRVLW